MPAHQPVVNSAAKASFAAALIGSTVLGFIDRPAFRYLCVGGFCALTNWVVMLLIDDQRYLVSSLVCFVPLGTLSFFLHAMLTFRARPSVRSWAAYLVGLLPGSALSLGILATLRDLAYLPLVVAIPATVAIMTIANFLVARLAIVGLAPSPAVTIPPRATMRRRVERLALGLYRRLRPHVRGRKIPRRRDFSLAVPFDYRRPEPRPADMTIAVICHLYYADLAAEVRAVVENIPGRADVFISTDTEDKRRLIADAFASWDKGHVAIRVLPNRGRDIAPKFVGFRDVFAAHDLILALHGKKTPGYKHGEAWRKTLFGSLAGSPAIVASILEIFRSDADVGMVISQHFEPIRPFVRWHHHFRSAARLARRMGFELTSRHAIDMASGSMFWARPAALRALLDLNLQLEDFPGERNQTNGTLAHAIERLLLFVCEASGYKWIKVSDPKLFSFRETIVAVPSPKVLGDFVATQSKSLLAHVW